MHPSDPPSTVTHDMPSILAQQCALLTCHSSWEYLLFPWKIFWFRWNQHVHWQFPPTFVKAVFSVHAKHAWSPGPKGKLGRSPRTPCLGQGYNLTLNVLSSRRQQVDSVYQVLTGHICRYWNHHSMCVISKWYWWHGLKSVFMGPDELSCFILKHPRKRA